MPLTSRVRHRLQLGAAIFVSVGSVALVARIAKPRVRPPAPAPLVTYVPQTPLPPKPTPPPIAIGVSPAPSLSVAFDSALRDGDTKALDRLYTKSEPLGLALKAAAGYGKRASVEWVLEHGADVHVSEGDVDAPLLAADEHADVVALLLERGAEEPDLSVAAIAGAPNAVTRILAAKKTANPGDGTTPLFDAVTSTLATSENRRVIVEKLLAAGADPNAGEGGSGKTPLAAAVELCTGEDDGAAGLALVQMLVAKRATVTGEALWAAFELDEGPAKGKAFDALLAGKLEPGATAVALSHATGDQVPFVKKVASRGVVWNWQDGESGTTAPLVDAVERFDVPLVKALLESGAPADLHLKDGRSALGSAIDGYASSSAEAERIVELLLARGANVNRRLPDGRPPLFAAAEAGNTRMLKALLDAGANVNERVLDETALDAAERSANIQAARILDGRGGRRAPPRPDAE
ncbi:MAG: ankyrin repeat domain-containing protein [Labilithrix sp.]|nr:ankyrin repeat domain-containing protein [Labilithrix sp.]MCW5810014.1 ankyrin repeat domain-containing protein [Labilithrix sp.]